MPKQASVQLLHGQMNLDLLCARDFSCKPYLEECVDVADRWDVVRDEGLEAVVEQDCLGPVLGDVGEQL